MMSPKQKMRKIITIWYFTHKRDTYKIFCTPNLNTGRKCKMWMAKLFDNWTSL